MEKINSIPKVEKINSGYFDWQLWRGGCLFDLGVIENKEDCIIANKCLLREYAVGYCNGESVPCRPKVNTYAVMFQKDDLLFWTHMTINEFERVFADE